MYTFASGLNFNNDGTKMYTSSMLAWATDRISFEYILTTAYDISTATLNNTKYVPEDQW